MTARPKPSPPFEKGGRKLSNGLCLMLLSKICALNFCRVILSVVEIRATRGSNGVKRHSGSRQKIVFSLWDPASRPPYGRVRLLNATHCDLFFAQDDTKTQNNHLFTVGEGLAPPENQQKINAQINIKNKSPFLQSFWKIGGMGGRKTFSKKFSSPQQTPQKNQKKHNRKFTRCALVS